jgi:hypothetical protein
VGGGWGAVHWRQEVQPKVGSRENHGPWVRGGECRCVSSPCHAPPANVPWLLCTKARGRSSSGTGTDSEVRLRIRGNGPPFTHNPQG